MRSQAEGSWIFGDHDGNKYLDFTSGHICSTTGHNYPRIIEAIREACARVVNLNSWMLSGEVIRQAERLAALPPTRWTKVILLKTASGPTRSGCGWPSWPAAGARWSGWTCGSTA